MYLQGVPGVLVDGPEGRGRPLVVESPAAGHVRLAASLVAADRVLYAPTRPPGILHERERGEMKSIFLLAKGQCQRAGFFFILSGLRKTGSVGVKGQRSER